MINLTPQKDCVWNMLNSMNDLLWVCVKDSLRYSLMYPVDDFAELTKIKIKHSVRKNLYDQP